MSKIGNFTEEQYSKLFQYTLDQVIHGSGRFIKYLIPGEINTIEPGHEYYIHNTYIRKELEQYGLTIQDYFDLLILHISDTDDRPKCPNCNKPLKFGGRLYYGYANNGYGWFDEDFHFCSSECCIQFRHDHPEIYGEFGFKNMTDEARIRMMNEARRTNFINLGESDDECYFYIASTVDGLFKFGISGDVKTRFRFAKGWCGYKNIKLIKTDTRINIADLEYNIKSEMKISSEYIEWTRVPEFIRIYNKYSK